MIHHTVIKRFFPILGILAGIFLASCNQNSIFYDISIEPDPKDPIIKGMPANLVLLNNRIYTASLSSSTIWEYGNGSGRWTETTLDPGGSIRGMAGAGNYLYVLIFTGQHPETAQLKRINLQTLPADWTAPGAPWEDGGDWDTIDRKPAEPYYTRLQSLYSANGHVFLGAQRTGDERQYAIFYVDGDKLSQPLKEDTALLLGAAWDGGSYYLATAGNGIFKISGSPGSGITGPVGVSSGTLNLNSETLLVMGIMDVGGKIIAAAKNNYLFYLEGTEFKTIRTAGVNGLTGAMAVWTDPDGTGEKLLLLGAQGNTTSLTHGYREVYLDLSDSSLPGGLGGVTIDSNNGYGTLSLSKPGVSAPSSVVVGETAKYDASIGTHPVLTILQVPSSVEPPPPGSDPLIFAGTSKNGLWSYRTEQWNAEEE
ncbi:MAG: hypothetical protein LBL43_00060 [Treponema sp.]|jgi:hypothetical protein|nr:hypothetical protein [Treponema sp.]